ncbi:response regulator [Duganella sp. S19_KUP01_CR8]|uniref:response regulator n=1 Tax=Duganella sp. S19_KUP01_CR8 TaxID=3025502 RepID=UPI002FCD7027
MSEIRNLNMLLVEEQTLLRRTVALTARSLGLGTIHEAATMEAAERLLREHRFHGAVISIDCGSLPGCTYNLALLDRMRNGIYSSDCGIPIAVMAEHATAELLSDLRERHVSRVILKPFRAKVLLDAFASFEQPASHKS